MVQDNTQHETQHQNQLGIPHETPHENPHELPCGSPRGILFQRVGDTIVLHDSAVPMPPDPAEEAPAFLLFLQVQPLAGGWIAHKDVGDRLYPAFCQVINRTDDLSWPAVARAFGRITKKRRRAVVQYYIPRPGRRRGAG